MLYIVSTPIGNLEDITLRALNTLFSVETILCEDTRKTLSMLKHFQKQGQVVPKLLSFFEENEQKRLTEVLDLLKIGQEIALVSNSGTPTISDPGFKLIRECVKENIKVVSIPGPASPIAALAISGLPTDKFLFLGFLPNKSGQRLKLFENAGQTQKNISATIIFFDPPFRIVKSLVDFQTVFGDIEIVICRELTKVYEEVLHGKVSFFIEKYTKKPPKGEFVVLFNLKEKKADALN